MQVGAGQKTKTVSTCGLQTPTRGILFIMAPVPGPRDQRQHIAEKVCSFKLASNVTTDLFNYLLTLINLIIVLFFHYYCFIIVFSLYFHRNIVVGLSSLYRVGMMGFVLK